MVGSGFAGRVRTAGIIRSGFVKLLAGTKSQTAKNLIGGNVVKTLDLRPESGFQKNLGAQDISLDKNRRLI